MAAKKNIVIIGAGTAGITTAQGLSKALDPNEWSIQLVSDRPFHLHYVALLRVLITDEGGLAEKAINPLDRVFDAGRPGEIVIGNAISVQEGVVLLEDGRQLSYDYLVLAVGTTWGGPLAFPKNVEDKDKWIADWRERFRVANDIVILGGGAVGIELAGELGHWYPPRKGRWYPPKKGHWYPPKKGHWYPPKKITIVHNEPLLLNAAYPDKFRTGVAEKLKGRGVNVVLGDRASIPEGKGLGLISIPNGKGLGIDDEDIAANPEGKSLGPNGKGLGLISIPNGKGLGIDDEDIAANPEGKGLGLISIPNGKGLGIDDEDIAANPEGKDDSITTEKGQKIKADLVVPTWGGRRNTEFLKSFDSTIVTPEGNIRILPTLRVPLSSGSTNVYAVGDAIDWAEQKQLAKIPGQVAVLVPNILAAIKNQQPPKEYKGGIEGIILPAGPNAGIAYLPTLGGITLGDWFSSIIKSKTLFVSIAQKATHYP